MDNIKRLRQLFEFDLNGFIVLPGFLSSGDVYKINGILDRQPDARVAHKFHFVTLDEIFLDLLSAPEVLEICRTWVNPYFRFDHAWGVQHYPDEPNPSERKNLHGGPYQEQGYFQYHWHNGSPSCSCIVFSYILEPQRKGDGGLVIVPGSHKTNVGLSGQQVFRNLLDRDHGNAAWVVQPELEAGDLLIFTEAAIHGTETWKCPDRRRRNLYYKYSHGFMSWPLADDEETQQLRCLARTDVERNLLRPPYVSTTTGNRLDWRPTTITDSRPQLPPGVLARLLASRGDRLAPDSPAVVRLQDTEADQQK